MAGTTDSLSLPNGTLRNKLGIDNAEVLTRVEAAASRLRFAALAQQSPPERLDYEHLKSIHAKAFGDLYEWAGKSRTVDLAPTPAATFAKAAEIEPRATELLAGLAAEKNLRGLTDRRFVQRSAHYLAKLHELGVFHHGNGRTERAFMSDVARSAGRVIDFAPIERKRLDDALKLTQITGQPRHVERIIAEALVRTPEHDRGPQNDRDLQR